MQNKAFSMEDLFAFLNAGVSAFHSTAAAAAILEAEGYRNCPESAAWHLVPGGKYYTTRNGSAILAWRMPKGPLTGWHAAASHSVAHLAHQDAGRGRPRLCPRRGGGLWRHADVHLV